MMPNTRGSHKYGSRNGEMPKNKNKKIATITSSLLLKTGSVYADLSSEHIRIILFKDLQRM